MSEWIIRHLFWEPLTEIPKTISAVICRICMLHSSQRISKVTIQSITMSMSAHIVSTSVHTSLTSIHHSSVMGREPGSGVFALAARLCTA